MVSRILSQVCSQTKYSLFISHITSTNATLASKISKSLLLSKSKTRPLTTIPFYQSNTVNAKNLIQNFSSRSSPVSAIKSKTPSNTPNTLIRGYFPPYYIFKEWENTKSFRSDKWYRYQRSKRRRHKKWLKKTRVKRLVRKTLLENRVKAMRENRALKEVKTEERIKARAERVAELELKRNEIERAKYKVQKEKYYKHEKLMKEMKEKRLAKLQRKALAAENPN